MQAERSACTHPAGGGGGLVGGGRWVVVGGPGIITPDQGSVARHAVRRFYMVIHRSIDTHTTWLDPEN